MSAVGGSVPLERTVAMPALTEAPSSLPGRRVAAGCLHTDYLPRLNVEIPRNLPARVVANGVVPWAFAMCAGQRATVRVTQTVEVRRKTDDILAASAPESGDSQGSSHLAWCRVRRTVAPMIHRPLLAPECDAIIPAVSAIETSVRVEGVVRVDVNLEVLRAR